MNYWNEKIECMSRDEMTALQNERLVAQVKHVYENVPYYRDLMDKKGVKPEDIKGIEDLHKLPFLSKADLRESCLRLCKDTLHKRHHGQESRCFLYPERY